MCSERHAHTDLARALRDSVGDHAVDANGCQSQGQRGEKTEQKHHEIAESERMGEHLIHGADGACRDDRIDGGNGIAHSAAEACGVDIGAGMMLLGNQPPGVTGPVRVVRFIGADGDVLYALTKGLRLPRCLSSSLRTREKLPSSPQLLSGTGGCPA
jgi:hypothetical protein